MHIRYNHTNDLSRKKIVFSGPVGAGKTTSIASVSDIEPVRTDERVRDDERYLKPETTVAMDYGVMSLDSGEPVHLYGTPGQSRFDFMWDILTQGGSGLVLLLNNKKINPLGDLDFYIGRFRHFIDRTAMVVGVTRMNEGDGPVINDYQDRLSSWGINASVFDVDCRKTPEVRMLVKTLLYRQAEAIAC